MEKNTAIEPDWKTAEHRWYPYIGKLTTPKGTGYVKYDGQRVSVHIALKIIINGVDIEKDANIETFDIQDRDAAHAWVESFLL